MALSPRATLRFLCVLPPSSSPSLPPSLPLSLLQGRWECELCQALPGRGFGEWPEQCSVGALFDGQSTSSAT